MQAHNKLPETEWHVPFQADTVPDNGKHVILKASPEQCKAVAKRLDILELSFCEAELYLSLRNHGHILHVEGSLKAKVTQSCVKTMQRVESDIADEFEAWFADHSKAIPLSRARHDAVTLDTGEEIPMLEEQDDPEPMVDGFVDLGDLVVQYLSLSINPYPRITEESGEEGNYENPLEHKEKAVLGASNLRPNPFAALKNWRPKD